MYRRTVEEINALKEDWIDDGCWDIEETEGFEAHRAELLNWRKEFEAKRQAEESERLNKRAIELQCSVALVRYIEVLEHRLSNLE